ncbi:MAG: hypothetical protein ACK5NK_16595 [Niabella sp.]
MKASSVINIIAVAISISLLASKPPDVELSGAWKYKNKTEEKVLQIADDYIMLTTYDIVNKKFISSFGGSVQLKGDQLNIAVEFNTADKAQTGKTVSYLWNRKSKQLITNISGSKKSWEQVDDGKKNLAGNWRIVQRKDGDKMADIPLRARRTYKLLTATRFQWAAVNIETGEFFGTGGGTYTFKDGKYTEHIEFFSRDSSRVGASLEFDAKLEKGNWIHSGLSSKGNPIYEVWGRVK